MYVCVVTYYSNPKGGALSFRHLSNYLFMRGSAFVLAQTVLARLATLLLGLLLCLLRGCGGGEGGR